jgi:hypothetical protein
MHPAFCPQVGSRVLFPVEPTHIPGRRQANAVKLSFVQLLLLKACESEAEK